MIPWGSEKEPGSDDKRDEILRNNTHTSTHIPTDSAKIHLVDFRCENFSQVFMTHGYMGFTDKRSG